ncbi:putative Ig domain-containing protein [Halomonas almeriensis]|uniref:putative Ig domain-containing protein n=1 Tax=Halomonas almeriensis TaxID=308163 RepID=UPI0025B32B2D|nr:putative Ig domain-containing protein [Halomonas almeriensis]MDN3552116.1 putative Ig domain-containing protein [Halomonas almeriensis]
MTGENDAPTTTGLGDQTSSDGDAITAVETAGAFSDVDNGDTLRYSAANLPSGLSIDEDTGEITGTLDANASQNGPYNVEVTAEDDAGDTVTAAFDWSVNNPSPIAQEDRDSGGPSRNYNGNVLDNDTDGGNDSDTLSVEAVEGVPGDVGAGISGDNGGLFTINANGAYEFDPNGDFADLESGESRETSVTYRVSDGNGGTDTATVSVEITPDEISVGSGEADTIVGGGGDDVLIGDTGGNQKIIEPTKNYNIAFVVDRSGSMGDDLNEGTGTRMQAAKESINNLLGEISGFPGEIQLHVNFFRDGGVEIEPNVDELTSDNVNDVQEWVNDRVADDGTYPENGFNAAEAWFSASGEPQSTNGFQNLVYYIADGDSNSSHTGTVIPAYQDMLTAMGPDAIVNAIALDNEVDRDNLADLDTEAQTGSDIPVALTAEDLASILEGGSTTTEDAPLGPDTLLGGAGNDVIFGDSVDPGSLGGPAGSGYETGSGYAGVINLITEQDGTEPDQDRILEFIRDNYADLTSASITAGGQDQLFGEAGDDVLIGTSGDDLLEGGTGSDDMLGGAGADVFEWKLDDEGSTTGPAGDTVKDFTLGDYGTDADADQLKLGDLLEGYDAGSDPDQEALDEYINASVDNGDTVLSIKTDGGIATDSSDADQIITLEGTGVSGADSQTMLQNLVSSDQLDVD